MNGEDPPARRASSGGAPCSPADGQLKQWCATTPPAQLLHDRPSPVRPAPCRQGESGWGRMCFRAGSRNGDPGPACASPVHECRRALVPVPPCSAGFDRQEVALTVTAALPRRVPRKRNGLQTCPVPGSQGVDLPPACPLKAGVNRAEPQPRPTRSLGNPGTSVWKPGGEEPGHRTCRFPIRPSSATSRLPKFVCCRPTARGNASTRMNESKKKEARRAWVISDRRRLGSPKLSTVNCTSCFRPREGRPRPR